GGHSTAISSPLTPRQPTTSPRWPCTTPFPSNAATATACNDLGETSLVTQATPILTTLATPTVLVTGSISDTATLAGGSGTLGGSITRSEERRVGKECRNGAIFNH